MRLSLELKNPLSQLKETANGSVPFMQGGSLSRSSPQLVLVNAKETVFILDAGNIKNMGSRQCWATPEAALDPATYQLQPENSMHVFLHSTE